MAVETPAPNGAAAGPPAAADETLLQVTDLRTYFTTRKGFVKAVDGISYDVKKGEIVAMVGESGCGKTVSVLSLLKLVPTPPARIISGEAHFEGKDLLQLNRNDMRHVRGRRIAVVFQEPMTSLNPVYTVGDQIMEAVQLHQGLNRKDARAKAIEMLDKVGIPKPDQRVDEYPHQMSGGMRQRVMIAMALSCDPQLLIADEPTTALDVTIQAQILDLMAKLQDDFGTSILFITHDLGVVAEVSDYVAVMYAGKVVEYADVVTLYEEPQHPYTVGLFKSLPDIDSRKEKLDVIEGVVPSPLDFPSGCRFRNRCSYENERCGKEEPLLRDVGNGHTVACHAVEEGRT